MKNEFTAIRAWISICYIARDLIFEFHNFSFQLTKRDEIIRHLPKREAQAAPEQCRAVNSGGTQPVNPAAPQRYIFESLENQMTRCRFAIALLLLALTLGGWPSGAQLSQSSLAQSSLAQSSSASLSAQPKKSNDPIDRIKDEGMNRSQVMPTLSYLTDVIGARLTGSPNLKRANEWTRDKLKEWGLENARLEAWGPFGRGWALKSFSAEVIAPQAIPLIAFPKAWSNGTNGPLTAEIVYVDAKEQKDLEKYRGALKGKIVLSGPIHEVKAHFEADGRRKTEKDTLQLADAPD
ncbi:MAG: hypothetical protein J2P31_01690, partial [Blastocatellia bacterium]|nr:hypothetical protein [Blastocatellia bacterium]